MCRNNSFRVLNAALHALHTLMSSRKYGFADFRIGLTFFGFFLYLLGRFFRFGLPFVLKIENKKENARIKK